MRNILIGYDGSARGDDALALGRKLAEASPGANVAVVTVYQALPPIGPEGEPRSREQRLHVAADETLQRAGNAWPELGERSFRVIAASSPSAGLQPLAAGGDFDVIVVGASHRRGLGRIWPGSATEQTLHGSPRAVAIAPPGYAETSDPQPLRRIGLAYDGSEEGRHALDLVGDLAVGAAAEVVAISVVDTVAPPLVDAYGFGSFVEDMRELADLHLAGARDRLAGRGVKQIVTERPEGGPVTELVKASRQLDLLVLGSRDHGPALRLLLGAVSSRVVRDAACPVLIWPRSARTETAAAAQPADLQAAQPGA